MAGYVLTTQALASIRTLVRGVLGDVTTGGDDRDLAREVEAHLAFVDGLDSDDLREVATWAREQARAQADREPNDGASAGYRRRKLAEYSRVTELCTDILEALALSKLPPAALLNIGRECHLCQAEIPDDCARVCMSEGCPLRPEPEPAANTMMSREQVESLPSADRMALWQILATLRGEPRTAKPHEGAAVDVLVELDVYLRKLATVLGVDGSAEAPALLLIAEAAADGREHWMDQAERRRVEVERLTSKVEGYAKDVDERNQWLLEIGCALGLDAHASTEQIIAAAKTAAEAEAERYALPDSHPLRSYRWGDWLDALLREAERASAAGFYRAPGGRLTWLREAAERVKALDVDGLRGMVERAHDNVATSPLSEHENSLLLWACASGRRVVLASDEAGAVLCGCNRVPRVGGGE